MKIVLPFLILLIAQYSLFGQNETTQFEVVVQDTIPIAIEKTKNYTTQIDYENSGTYKNWCNETLVLNADSTYLYTFLRDNSMYSSKGNWQVKTNQLILIGENINDSTDHENNKVAELYKTFLISENGLIETASEKSVCTALTKAIRNENYMEE